MKNGKDGGVAYRPRRLEGWRSMGTWAKCKGGYPEGPGVRPPPHHTFSDIVAPACVPKPETRPLSASVASSVK